MANPVLVRGMKENSSVYDTIEKRKGFYLRMLESGMFYEYFPELTGSWSRDRDTWLSYWN